MMACTSTRVLFFGALTLVVYTPRYLAHQLPAFGIPREAEPTTLPQVAATRNATAASGLVIQLDKQYVPVLRDGRAVLYKTAYFGSVFVGVPQAQKFTVVFDTGSGHFVVPSSTCASASCRGHSKYKRSASASAVDVDQDGNVVNVSAPGYEAEMIALAYGTGEIEGTFVQDRACLFAATSAQAVNGSDSQSQCVDTRVVLATTMTKEPFRSFQFDGILGLGLEALALKPEFSFFGQLVRQRPQMLQRFGVFLAHDDDIASEITIGGHDVRRFAGDLMWSPVARPELGYWTVEVLSVRIGSTHLKVCDGGGCAAIVDTGTSLLGVPQQVMAEMNQLLARQLRNDPGEVDCRDEAGPDLVFELGGGVELTLGPADYSRAAGLRVITSATNLTQFVCRSQLLPVGPTPGVGQKAWILGEPALRRYYTAYDWGQKKVGFALAAQPSPTAATLSNAQRNHHVYGAPPHAPPTPSVVVM